MKKTLGEDDPVLAAIRSAPMGEPMPAEHRAAVEASMAELRAGAPTFTTGEVLVALKRRRDGEGGGSGSSEIWAEFDREIAAECARDGLTEAQLHEQAETKRAACAEARARLKAMAAGKEPALPMAQVYAEVKAKYGLS